MLTVHHDDSSEEVFVVRVGGSLDACTVASFRQDLAEATTQDCVVIDLSGLTFIDYAGLGALVGVIRRIRELGGEVSVACMSPGITRILRGAGLERLVILTADFDEALTAMNFARAQGRG